MPRILSTLTLLACLSATLSAGEIKPPNKSDPPLPLRNKYTPRDVEIKLQDGSLFRGEIVDLDTFSIKTVYGSLTVPIADMLHIDRGDHVGDKDLDEIRSALKDLDNDEFAKRSAAQYRLEAGSPAALDVIKAAREGASPESKNRLDAVIKKLTAKNQNRRVQLEDSLRTARFEVTGLLQFSVLKLKSRLGELTVKIEDLQSVRWLSRGENKTVLLEPAAMVEWIDTGIDSIPGEKLALITTGTINPNNNQEIGPNGSDNWGNQGLFLMGAVIGRMGSNGEQFLVGTGKLLTSETNERLYLKIFWNTSRSGRSTESTKGKFTVKIATGAWADELDMGTGDH